MEKDSLGNRMKEYENQTCGIKLIPRLPIIARLDGKGFSKFTKGLKRPFDERLSSLMIETTKFLVSETNANCGYTQSDEITLLWYSDEIQSQSYFGGRLFKIIGDLSSLASVFFNRELINFIPEKSNQMPRFDCRVYNVPNLDEATNSFVWREMDATKNSISMASQEFYSHKQLQNKSGKEKQEMLFRKGINWNDYPDFFKRGTYIQRVRTMSKFSEEEIEILPVKHMARTNPDFEIERWKVEKINLPKITSIKNRTDVIVWGKNPIIADEKQIR
jgi:tRNA(His) 5'-end guanylyltransferase